MRNEDSHRLLERLTELAEYYGVNVPSAAAIKVWLDVLREAHFDDVAGVLTDWPKTNARFPTGDAVLKAVRAAVSARIERQAAANRATSPTVESVLDPHNPQSPVAQRELAKIRNIMSLPKLDPEDWPWSARRREQLGDSTLKPYTRSLWRKQLGYPSHIAIEHTNDPDARTAERVEAHLELRDVDASKDALFDAVCRRVRAAHRLDDIDPERDAIQREGEPL